MLAAIFFLLILGGSTDAMVVNGTEMTMDQAIMAASESSNMFKLMEDADVVRVEMDMLFKADVWESMMRQREKSTRRQKRKAIRAPNLRWANASIPYQIAVPWTDQERQPFQEALNDYHTYTCVRFREATASDVDYLRVVDGGGCSSFVGRQGGAQKVSLSRRCRMKGVIVHELGHAVGFHHEQTRPDRDEFLKIVEENVVATELHNFQRYTAAEVDAFGVPYDYLSVMHYGEFTFSKNGQRTILTRDTAFQQRIGQRGGFSFRDIKLVNLMYGCAAKSKCPERQCPGEGFVGPDCACWCPSGDDALPVTLCSGITQPSPTPLRTAIGRTQLESNARTHRTTLPQTASSLRADATTAARGRPCSDANAMCSAWAQRGECHAHPGYMLSHCAASCRSCEGADVTTAAAARCLDEDARCHYWRGLGRCSSKHYAAYMQLNCPRACGVCSTAASAATPAATAAARTMPRTVATTTKTTPKAPVAISAPAPAPVPAVSRGGGTSREERRRTSKSR